LVWKMEDKLLVMFDKNELSYADFPNYVLQLLSTGLGG